MACSKGEYNELILHSHKIFRILMSKMHFYLYIKLSNFNLTKCVVAASPKWSEVD